MAPTKDEHFSALRSSIISTTSLLENFKTVLKSPFSDHPTTVTKSPNPLALLSDASAILKAQTTKLSLLILNKPFTPSAITYILTSLSTSCLPALVSALELCPPATYSALLHQHLRTLLSRAFGALSALLATIPQDERSADSPRDRDALAATGLLWETCDSMTKLASTGLPALAIDKLDTYHSLLKDAITELEEWDPNEDTDTDSNPDSTLPETTTTTTTPSHQTAHLLILTLNLLRHIRLLYPALKKRRIRPFPPLPQTSDSTSPPTPSQIQTLDTLLTTLNNFTSEADEIAGALYTADENEVLNRLSSLRNQAVTCIHHVLKDWKGNEDEFSIWAQKWINITKAMNSSDDSETPTEELQLNGNNSSSSKSSNSLVLKSELPLR